MSDRGKCQVCLKICDSRCCMCRTVYYCSKEHQKEDWSNHKENCSKQKYMIDKNDKLGRFLVATEDIKADHILFKDKPLVIGPKFGLLDVEEEKQCLGCYRILSSSKDEGSSEDEDDDSVVVSTCSKCTLPICSSSECGSQYFHKQFECKLFREAIRSKEQQQIKSNQIENGGDSPSPSECQEKVNPEEESINECKKEPFEDETKDSFIQYLLYFRCILLKYVNEKQWNEMMNLQSNNEHREDLSNLEKTTRVFEEMKTTLSQIGHPTINTILKPDLHKILGILDTNAVGIKISQTVELTGLYPTFSMMEYSCAPTAKFYFVPPPPPTTKGDKVKSGKHTYELYCRNAVKLLKGDHISIMVTNMLWNTQKRREEMKKTKYFWCECSRCMDPTELGSNVSSLLCPICKAISVPVPKSPSSVAEHEFQWQCVNEKCGKTCEVWQVKKVDSKLSETIGKLATKATTQQYKDMLSQFELLVHPDYYLCFIVNHSLLQMQGHDDQKNNKDVLEEKLTICNRLLGTIKKLDPGLAQLNVYTAVIYYEMHSCILGLVGGEVDDDFKILRKNPETVKLARVYLQKCIDCFQYEFLDSPETKLRILARKKLEYLNMLLKHS